MRRVAVAPLALVVATAAMGWMYVVRPSASGPRVRDALPLDELAHHSSAPVVWFVAVWAVAALFLGALARWARLERLVAAAVLALCVGLWLYLVDGTSIAVVRQIPARDAFERASTLNAVYLPAALAALGGAVVADPRRRLRAHFAVAWAVAAAGFLDLLLTVLPGRNEGVLRSLTPDAIWPLARAAHAPIGLALLIAARGLARRRRRAWRLATGVAAVSTALHVLHGVNQGTLSAAVVLVLLVARRHDFDGPGDTSRRRVIAARTLASVLGIAAYGTAALWVNRVAADQPFTFRFALDEILRGVFGLHVAGSPHLAGGFGDWFPLSLLLLGIGATAWIVGAWLAPWRYRLAQEARERTLARELVRAWGADTLAPFALRADKSYFFSEDARAFLAYRVVGHVAIVSGDPVGPEPELDDLVARFVDFAHERDWRLAILGASESRLELYRRHGLHALYHGDEAIVDTAEFSLEGRAIRKVRQSVHRLEHAGYRARVLTVAEIDNELRDELEEIARRWRGDAPERGFVMALDALFRLDDAVFVVGLDTGDRPVGFLHFAVSPAGSALSLSSMPRLRSVPNGFNEWLICEAIAWAREHGYDHVSLNFAPFASLLAPEAELTPLQEVQARTLRALKGHFQLDNLLLFNRKFFPRWERRFVVYERRRDLPRVGVAALAAEAYLPFQGTRR